MNSKLIGNYVNTPIGFKVGIKFHSNSGEICNASIIDSKEMNEYISIFDEDDVDFTLELDNRGCGRGIRITLIINDKNNHFYISPGETSILKTLKNNGRKLHFLSQKLNDGQILVGNTAKKYSTSFENASIICSKIIFCIEVEKQLDIVNWSKGNHRGEKIHLNIETLFGKNIYINIGNDDFVLDLKKKLAEIEGVSNEFTLIYNSNILEDFESLKRYGIDDGSKLIATNLTYQLRPPIISIVKHPFRGFGNRDNRSLTVTDGIYQPLGTMGVNDVTRSPYSLGGPLTTPTLNSSKESSDNRGVICYGEKSNQKFDKYTGFIKDFSLIIKDFVIELKINSKYIPI